MNWSSIDGESWTITIGDTKAEVWLGADDKKYIGAICSPQAKYLLTGEFDCIKEAKKACLDEIERIDAYEAQQAQEAEEASAMFRESDDGMPA